MADSLSANGYEFISVGVMTEPSKVCADVELLPKDGINRIGTDIQVYGMADALALKC